MYSCTCIDLYTTTTVHLSDSMLSLCYNMQHFPSAVFGIALLGSTLIVSDNSRMSCSAFEVATGFPAESKGKQRFRMYSKMQLTFRPVLLDVSK
mgnify:CR=1 FL=1